MGARVSELGWGTTKRKVTRRLATRLQMKTERETTRRTDELLTGVRNLYFSVSMELVM